VGQDKSLGGPGEVVIGVRGDKAFYVGESGVYQLAAVVQPGPGSVNDPAVSQQGGLDMHAVRRLYEAYEPGYAFPEWVLRTVPGSSSRYTGTVVVYYDQGCTLSDARQAALFREPANIGMERHYDQRTMERNFGWRNGWYGTYLDKRKTLAPNIAIYCRTPVLYKEEYVDAHVVNAIGYAFDHKDQPDYKYFVGNQRQKELGERYEKVFHKIFACARDQGLGTVAMSLVGGGFFAEKYVDPSSKSTFGHQATFLREVWVPAFKRVVL